MTEERPHEKGLPLSRTQRTIAKEVGKVTEERRASMARLKRLVQSSDLNIAPSSRDTLLRAIEAETPR